MTVVNTLLDVPGARELVEWFGRIPRFHDAKLREITLSSVAPSQLRISAWNMTDKVDDKGFFILEKHAVVTITLHAVKSVNLSDFDLPGIIFDLEISKIGDMFKMVWSGSYGVEGSLTAKELSFTLEPGKTR